LRLQAEGSARLENYEIGSVTAGLKPRPSISAVRSPGYNRWSPS
jgi:hypothetical protein